MATTACKHCGISPAIKGGKYCSKRCKQERDKVRSREKARSRKADAVRYKGGACEDCGVEGHPAIYDFHHDGPEKNFNVSAKIASAPWSVVLAELDLTVLLCSHCHRLRHWLD